MKTESGRFSMPWIAAVATIVAAIVASLVGGFAMGYPVGTSAATSVPRPTVTVTGPTATVTVTSTPSPKPSPDERDTAKLSVSEVSPSADSSDQPTVEGKQSFMKVSPPLERHESYEPLIDGKILKVSGQDRADGFAISAEGGFAISELKGKYSTVEFDVGRADVGGKSGASLIVRLDDQYYEQYYIQPSEPPRHLSIPVVDINRIKFELVPWDFRIGEGVGTIGFFNMSVE